MILVLVELQSICNNYAYHTTFYTYDAPLKGRIFKPFANFKQNLTPEDDVTAKIQWDTVLQFDNFDINLKNLTGDTLDTWPKTELTPCFVLRVIIMSF